MLDILFIFKFYNPIIANLILQFYNSINYIEFYEELLLIFEEILLVFEKFILEMMCCGE